MGKNNQRLRCGDFMLVCVTVFLLVTFMVVDGKAADPADYPSRPIEYVVHSSPGGGMGTFARLVSDIVQKENILSQPMVVVNKPGAGGGVAMGYIFEKKANPYLILGVSASTFICTTLLEKLPYSIKSFTPIANLSLDGAVLAVRSDSPFKTADDLIVEAKKKPNKLIQGGSSFTSPTSMTGRAMQKATGVKWRFISFKREAEALLNVLSGNVDFVFIGPSKVVDHVRAGKARVLLSAAPYRLSEFKDAPTMKEAGMGEPVVILRGVVGPPDMPDYAVKKLEAAFKKVMDSERFKKYLTDKMMQPAWMDADEYGKLLEKDNDSWKAALSELDLLKK